MRLKHTLYMAVAMIFLVPSALPAAESRDCQSGDCEPDRGSQGATSNRNSRAVSSNPAPTLSVQSPTVDGRTPKTQLTPATAEDNSSASERATMLDSSARAVDKLVDTNASVPPACGPFSEEIPRSSGAGYVAPALAVYRDQLHLVSQEDLNCDARRGNPVNRFLAGGFCNDYKFPLFHRVFENGKWGKPKSIPNQMSKKGVGLAAFGNHLHMVHLGNESNQLWYSTFDGRGWSPNVKIRDQKSKKRPVLAKFGKELHMLHLGDSSDDLWHSRYVPGRGWTRNVRVGEKSSFTPGIIEYRGRLHMVRTTGDKLLHDSFDGRQWRKHVVVPVRNSSAPVLAFNPGDGRQLLELTTLRQGRLSNALFSPQRGWFDNKSLADLSSDAPVAVTQYKGCWHMVSVKENDNGTKLVHTTFSLTDVHPAY
jgi:hypothetical protein